MTSELDKNRIAVELLGWTYHPEGVRVIQNNSVMGGKYYWVNPEGDACNRPPDLSHITEGLHHITPFFERHGVSLDFNEVKDSIWGANLSYSLDRILDDAEPQIIVESEFRYGEGPTKGKALVDAFIKFISRVREKRRRKV